jgi:HPt (histidine-containing phosphotransfer) domain-containing protein
MNDYISKPFLIEEIVHKIKQWGQKTIQTVAMEEPEKPQQEILNISVINKLRNIGNGNGDEFIMEVISMFILQAERIIENINIYCGEKRYEEMGQAAHKLKGSALNVGAEALAKICKQLELKARIGDGGDCEKMMDKLNDINSKTTIELKKIS